MPGKVNFLISVVIPCYNEAKNVMPMFADLQKMAAATIP